MNHRFVHQRHVILAALVCLATGCGGLNEREADLFEQARAATESHDWRLAAGCLDAVLDAAPEYVPAYFLRGRANFELGRHDKALEDLERASSSGELTEDESFVATCLRGRSLLELGRAISPDSDLRSTEGKPEDRKRARDYFLKANLAFITASTDRADDYEAHLWRGISVLRLENYRKALDSFAVCERLAPKRWEHRFFTALSWEGLYKINAQSLETYLAIAAESVGPAQAPVFEHIASIAEETGPEVSRQFLEATERFARAVPNHSPRIESYLRAARARREAEARAMKLKQVADEAGRLRESGKYREAVALLEGYQRSEGESPELVKLLKETQESWSVRLEVECDDLLKQSDRDQLEKAARNLEQARTLTSKVERLVAIQQKLSQVHGALNRQESSKKIQQAYDLHRGGKHQAVLDLLTATSLEGMSDADRDRYHYLRGASSHALGQWSASVRSFASINQRSFDGLDVLHGLALIRSGQEAAGIAMLQNLTAEARTDEVNRALGLHFAERGDLRKAILFLAAVKAPKSPDLETHLKARLELGREYYRQADFARAVEELQAARQIAEAQLHRRVNDIYLYLGNSYFRLEELERAKKAYQDLTSTDLTRAEKEQCRELFLYRAQIHLREKSPDLAYADFAELVRLGGQIPAELSNTYSRLLATYAEFMPLDRVQYWNYVSTTKDYNYTLFVKAVNGGDRIIERREAGNTTTETWSRQGILLVKQIGENLVKLPVNTKPGEDAPPFVEYASQGQACSSEVVAVGQTVETVNGTRFADCLKVRFIRKQETAEGTKYFRHIHYFAPNVGEVKQEIYWDDRKVSEIVLSDFALRTGALGN